MLCVLVLSGDQSRVFVPLQSSHTQLQQKHEGAMRLYDMGEETERRPFLDRLFSYMEEKGTPIAAMPMISKQPIDLYRLYLMVKERGGLLEVRYRSL